jgi:hypothetical protein
MVNESENNASTSQKNISNSGNAGSNSNTITMFSERIGVKIPPLWSNNVSLWFMQIESQFEIANITSEDTKYSYLIAHLDQNHIQQVSDILYLPSCSTRYTRLKNAIIQRMSLSTDMRREKIFSGIQLGDRKPSQLLREIRTLSDGLNLDESTIHYLWLQQVPKSIQAHLTSNEKNLEELAIIADRLSIVYNSQEVSQISSNENIKSLEKSVTDLTEKLNKLTLQMQQVSNQSRPFVKQNNRNFFQRNNNFSKQRTNTKFNYQSNNSFNKNSKSMSNAKELCYYHTKFGDQAQKCNKPCSFLTTNNQKN